MSWPELLKRKLKLWMAAKLELFFALLCMVLIFIAIGISNYLSDPVKSMLFVPCLFFPSVIIGYRAKSIQSEEMLYIFSLMMTISLFGSFRDFVVSLGMYGIWLSGVSAGILFHPAIENGFEKLKEILKN